MLKEVITREICGYEPCDRNRRLLIDVLCDCDFLIERRALEAWSSWSISNGAWKFGLINVIPKI